MKRRSIPALLSLLVIAGLAIAGAGTARAAPLRWSGLKLIDRAQPFGTPASISAVSCPAAAFCFAVGSQGTVVTATASGPPKLVRNGVQNFASLRDVSCPTVSLCVAIENTAVLVSRNPRAAKPLFKRVSLKLGLGLLESIDCPTASLCLAMASDGNIWTSTRPTGPASTWRPTAIAGAGRSLLAFGCAPGGRLCVASLGGVGGSNPQLATTTTPSFIGPAAGWAVAPAPSTYSVTAVSCPSTSLCVGASYGQVLSSATPARGGSTWTATQVTDPAHAEVGGIGCGSASPASCIATVSDGSVVVGSGAAAAPAWTRSAVLDPRGLGSVACLRVATANCLAPNGRGGGIARILAPPAPAAPTATVTSAGGLTAITDLACPSASLCVGVDDAGAALRTSRPAGPGSGWRRRVQPAASVTGPEALTGPAGLSSVSCPSTRFCAAVGAQDTLLTTTTPGTNALWRVTKLPFQLEESAGTFLDDLGDISCPSSGLCVSTGSSNQLFVSTRPAGGASTWRAFSLASFNYDTWTSVACPRANFCIAGDSRNGRLAESTAPGRSWRVMTLFRGGVNAAAITDVACPSIRLCLVGTRTGALWRSTNPAGGVRSYRRIKLSRRDIVGLACRSARLCLAIDALGRVWSSTTPAGRLSTWHEKTLDFHNWPTIGGRLSAVACAPRAVCVAGDGGGRVYSGR